MLLAGIFVADRTVLETRLDAQLEHAWRVREGLARATTDACVSTDPVMGRTPSMSPLETILVVSVAVPAISVGIVMLEDVLAELDRRRRRDDFAAVLHEVTVSAPARRPARTKRRYGSAYGPTATGRARHRRHRATPASS
jgi:hypothetical protein